ncbi:PDZK1-interacting protein 1-like isoform X2 [Hypanus sabinus]|uniref:PDZK1-interacting protein 1-like isoform X2 n=1 Tax=Hypanus sabinus TaxID=79690 RepID=UPI0028C4F237|nr:PDZK1-interacting protein 1-like isoform X2 [Hypanus sabinus]
MPNLSQCATRQRQRPLGVRSPVVARDVSQPSPLLLFSRVRLGTCPERLMPRDGIREVYFSQKEDIEIHRKEISRSGETKEQPRRVLQPWLTGIIAVVVFLCLCFIGFIVNKIWCKNAEVTNHLESPALEPDYANTNGTPVTGSSLEDVRSNEHPNAYENIYQTFNDESPKITVTEM